MEGHHTSHNRAEYPEIKAEIGEDPARFLDTKDPEGFGSDEGDTPQLALAFARIRGIDNLPTLERWVEVEADLDCGPRRHVMSELNLRKKQLEEEQSAETEEIDTSGGVSA